MTDFLELAKTLDEVSNERGRNAKIEIVAEFLRSVDRDEVGISTLLLAGRIFPENDQRSLNLSWAGVKNALRQVRNISDEAIDKAYDGDIADAISKVWNKEGQLQQTGLFSEQLTLGSLFDTLEQIAEITGRGAKKTREGMLAGLFREATGKEMKYLVALLLGDLRTGLSSGLMSEGIARAFSVDPSLVRRAWSFTGSLKETAEIASQDGEHGLERVQVIPFRAVMPMLATPAEDIESILEDKESDYAFEPKFDGARIQIHKSGERVRVFSRRLTEVTDSIPEIVDLICEEIMAETVILDGEVLAVDETGRPFPFQVVMKRFGRVQNVEKKREEIALDIRLFDVLFVDAVQYIDEPYTVRRKELERIAPDRLLTKSVFTDEPEIIRKMFVDTKQHGHEGLIAKKIHSKYVPGKRGRNWYKLKHTLETLDLVIIAAEWGYGRRKDWLSDYHLAVRHQDTGEFVMIGKTFKGLTDDEFKEMTKRLLEIETGKKRGTVFVKPSVVVEVIAEEIQTSPTYRSGYALRFARVKNIRYDKSPEDATTLRELESIYETQFDYKARHS